MKTSNHGTYQIDSDGITVWVNDAMCCIGRFCRMGIDIHNPPGAASECLFCTHAPVTSEDWQTFVAKMRELYAVTGLEPHCPTRFAA